VGKIVNWIKQNKKEAIILAMILLIGAFCRLYKIDQYMTFLGDEGRDVIVVRRIFTELHPPLIGPGTSIGNMYLGPLYYYMMAIPLLLAGFNPVGPAIMVALLGVTTIFFAWLVARQWFGKIAATVAAGLYAISPTVIIYSRSSWNPNIMPFFALLCIYSIWRVWQEDKFNWLIVLGISFAFVLQSHYLGLLLIPTLGIFWFLTLFKLRSQKIVNSKLLLINFLRKSLIGLVLFLILMSPLVIFDARHDWRNFAAIKTFFTVRQETISIKPWKAIPNMWPVFEKAISRILTARNETVGMWVSLGVLILVFWNLVVKREFLKKNRDQFLIIFLWLGFAILGLSLYKQEIYDHYYGFFFTTPFLLLAGLCQGVYETGNREAKAFLGIVLILLVYLNLIQNPLKYPPNMQMQRSQTIAKFIAEKAGGERLNVATISERNNRDVYQYFLQLDGAKVVDTDPLVTKLTVTDQLFVVCEKPKKDCDPVNDPSAWITNFGWTKIEDSWDVWGTTVFKLVHAK
jgi:4-amino-4-deoxy-L-arabinose transferase-like glycosyltransferase